MAIQNDKKDFVKEVADMEADFPQWYTDVVLKTQLCDYGPVKGTMVIRPYGYAVWELIQKQLDDRIKATGHKNAYFPLFFPESFLQREAEHVAGFAPECALVTHVGKEKLAENLAIRPTSETVICEMYSKWIQSWRDLPLLINQWANVVRWEKTTRPFLRTSEFLWQEGHTVHATFEEAQEETIKMLHVYREFVNNVLAIPVLIGQKTEKEKFAGAHATYSMEAMMLDGKSLQAGTSHNLADHFSKAFDIQFLDKDGARKYAWQSSWGVTTRLIGALVMVHGDRRGIVLPPAVAPIQTIVIPIAAFKPGVTEKAAELCAKLIKAGVRAEIDNRDQSPGWKFNEWEMKGVPIRLEIGPRDLERGVVAVARRDTLEKTEISADAAVPAIKKLLKTIQKDMFKKADSFFKSRIQKVGNLEEMRKAVDGKNFALANWCGCRECEDRVKQEMQATARNVPFEHKPFKKVCAVCGKPAVTTVYFARAY
ncbi:proline--tRNA ligase [Clostridia bacterium]|nr:proline--tRNA ligase [Clostridia bacterium]